MVHAPTNPAAAILVTHRCPITVWQPPHCRPPTLTPRVIWTPHDSTWPPWIAHVIRPLLWASSKSRGIAATAIKVSDYFITFVKVCDFTISGNTEIDGPTRYTNTKNINHLNFSHWSWMAEECQHYGKWLELCGPVNGALLIPLNPIELFHRCGCP